MPNDTDVNWGPAGLNLHSDGTFTYSWRGRRLEAVLRGNTVVARYTYRRDGTLATREAGGMTEHFAATMGRAEGTFSITDANGQVLERYWFENMKVTRFQKGGRDYIVRTMPGTQSIRSLDLVFETITSTGPGGMGPAHVRHVFRQAFALDDFGQPWIVFDENFRAVDQAPLPHFIFYGQYYDSIVEIYYLYNHIWYHPRIKKTLNRHPPPWLPVERYVDPSERYGYIRPPLSMAELAMAQRRALHNAELPVAVTSRISGTGRVIAGTLTFVASLPVDGTVVGAPVGIVMAVWSGDQIGTGLKEIWTGEHHSSMGGQLARYVLGDGLAGRGVELVYDVAPGAVPATRLVQRTTTTSREVAVASEALSTEAEALRVGTTTERTVVDLGAEALRVEAGGLQMGVEAAQAPEYVAMRIEELRQFLRTRYPGRAGQPYTFAVWALPPQNGRCQIVIALNNPLKGIPFSEFPALGLVRENELFVYTLAKADAEATAIWHFPGNAIGGATRHACGSCTGLMMRNHVHPMVPYRYLGVNPNIRSGNPGMFQFFRTFTGVPDEAFTGMSRTSIEEFREFLIRQYRTSGRHGGRFRIETR